MDPHTTQKKSRTCKSCHQNPLSLGLGTGQLSRKTGFQKGVVENTLKWEFTPANRGIKNIPIDSFVTIEGKPLANFSRPWLRPFNRQEIERILEAGLCITCHNTYDDPVIKQWRPGEAIAGKCTVLNKKTPAAATTGVK